MNESCFGIGRSVDPEIGLIDAEIGRPKAWFSRSPDHPITRSPDETGFTLFEVLISITLIGFLMVALLVGLRVANRAWRTGEARLRRVHADAERNAFVVEQISSLLPYQVTPNDPNLQGTFIVLQASSTCLRFVTSYGSVFRSRSGLLLAEYGIVEEPPGNIEVALHETPVGDNDVLLHRLIRSVTNDPDTGASMIEYQPFLVSETDLPLMTGLRAAWFEYLDLHPEKGTPPAEKGTGPVWRQNWKSRDEAPYPEAIRLCWDRGTQAEEEEIIPVRAKSMPQSKSGQ
jgi:hypothetical protein